MSSRLNDSKVDARPFLLCTLPGPLSGRLVLDAACELGLAWAFLFVAAARESGPASCAVEEVVPL